MTRAARMAWWIAPFLFCIALYWLGARIWFEQDDFAWLGLRAHVTDFSSFLKCMFAPLAQGSVRPWSERGFFMLFSWFFGERALPYRLFVFANQFLNIALVMLVARKLTKSDLAAIVAALLWLANVALVTPMAWTSAYNEIQCATFLLLSFYLFIRYTETGERKFYWAQCATFLLGFGALEVNVVYPAIAALYALLFARRYLKSTLPLFAVSAAFVAVDRLAGSQQGNFYYDMSFRPGLMLQTLWRYWRILLDFDAFTQVRVTPPAAVNMAVVAVTVALLGFTAWQAWKRRFLPLFLLCWFLIVLGPLLPLHNHITEYYLTIPAIGIAMLAAYGLARAWRSGIGPAAIAAALILLYAWPSTTVVQAQMQAFFDRTDRARALVQSVAYAKKIHPGKTILLRNIDDSLFWTAVYDSPFRALGWHDVFLTPDCRAAIHEDPHLGPVSNYILPASAVSRALNDQAAVVYAVEGRKLRNVTRSYTRWVDQQPEPPLARNIDLGVAYYKDQIGDGWYAPENGFRWSKKRADVYLPGPAAAKDKLYVHGFAMDQLVKAGPLHFALTVEGRAEPVETIEHGSEFEFSYALPVDLIGRPKMEVAFTLDRTTQVPGDDRNLGLAFGQFSIR